MNREVLIKKWLDNNLNPEEQKAFEQLNDYEELIKLNAALKQFKAPGFSVDDAYQKTKNNLQTKTKNTWLKPLLRIAAILAIGFSVFYYTTTLDTEIKTDVAQQTSITLPDYSKVKLNANSYLVFNENNWSKNRKVELEGEAFFKVAKGQKFDVITEDGIVSVLGTQFNVKNRTNFFEVTCYEGLVGVKYNNKYRKLKPGDTFKILDGKLIAEEKETITKPSWINGESTFKNEPLKHVISEFENQYDYSVDFSNIDTSRNFTGGFTHKNLELALKSITLPLNLSYTISGNTIKLKRE